MAWERADGNGSGAGCVVCGDAGFPGSRQVRKSQTADMATTTETGRGRSMPLMSARSPSRALAETIKRLAADHGLTVAAITTGEGFPELAARLEAHIAAGHVRGLDWFTAERARFSTEPRNLHPTIRSIVSVGVAYWSVDSGKPDDGEPRGRIARYAWGVDYHDLLKTRMEGMHRAIEEVVGRGVEARRLVDTARIVDRAVAARAGLGWYGKNACIIVPGRGSWVLLGELLLDLDLEPDAPLAKDCGRCRICLDRCPTGAIVAPYTVDTPRCLSFQTIEQRGAIPRELRPLLGDWVFGCDVCQEVCPYTRAARPDVDPAFLPRTVENAYPSLRRLLAMSEEEFRGLYRGTPVTRAKRRGLARNAAVALGNVGTEEDVPHLAAALAGHDEPLVRGHAAWSLGRLGGAEARRALERARGAESDADVLGEIGAALADVR